MDPGKQNTAWDIFLIPLSWLYRLVVGLRNYLFDLNILQSKEFNIPVISIGNLSAGGTGKTPMVEFLTDFLAGEYKIATLSRGYKRKSKGFIIADENSTAEQIGDEPMQIHRKFPDITVAVDNKRVHGIEELQNRVDGLELVLLDDAYQHRYVKPGLSIMLMDKGNPIWEDHLLPWGRLREHPSEKKRAQIVVITKCPADMKPIEQRIIQKELNLFAYQRLYFTSIAYSEIEPVFGDVQGGVNSIICREGKYHILIVSGIANTRDLRKHMRSLSPRIKEINFADHHDFSEKDIQQIQEKFNSIEGDNKIIISTEKDSVRLQKFNTIAKELRDSWYYIPIQTVFLNKEEKNFKDYISNYVKSNRRDNILSAGKH